MNPFFKQRRKKSQAPDDTTTFIIPFAEQMEEASGERTVLFGQDLTAEPPQEIEVKPAAAGPIQTLHDKITADVEPDAPAEPAQEAGADEQDKPEATRPVKPDVQTVERGSLLAKCMPYISDDDGVNYAEEKPNYTLESVEEIIGSAERRAKEKIAQLYNLTYDETTKQIVEPDETDIVMQPDEPKAADRIGDQVETASGDLQEPQSLPTESNTLFDDFSGHRTVVTPTKSVTTSYSKLAVLQTGGDDGRTKVLPQLRPESNTQVIYEDIVSHTRPVNIQDAPAVQAAQAKPSAFSAADDPVVEADDYVCAADAKRIGLKLGRERRAAFLRLISTALLTLVIAVFHLPFMSDFVNDHAATVSVTGCILFVAAIAVNLNLFSSFKTAFTKRMTLQFPVALCCSAMAVYLLYGLIAGLYPFDASLLAFVSLLFYDLFAYRKTAMVFANFKMVAARKEKQAVALIDDPQVTYSMARSSIEGDVLAAGTKRTAEITDFMKHTLSDTSFGGHLPIVLAVLSAVAVLIALAVGISYRSFSSALCALASVLCLGAMPTLPVADLLPITATAAKLRKFGAAVCGKFSAAKLEPVNAVVVDTSALFPDGCITLYTMRALGANNIDETLIEAAAVAASAKSPLAPVFEKIVKNALIPHADSIKYEDNLGLSGWVGDHHLLIGNRTLMESHGVRVPPLEVDRKILHKGYFPVYITCDERACALLIVQYRADGTIASELGRLISTGVTLLISNCDPNITEEMLCDYYGLYPDGVKIMDHNGAARYKTAVNYSETTSAHAFTGGGILGFVSLMTACIKLHTASNLLYALHIIGTVVSCLLFAVFSLSGTLNLMGAGVCLLLETLCLLVCLIGYFFSRP